MSFLRKSVIGGEMMEEIWKDVIGYENIYMVSSLGRMKSKERIIKRSNGWDYIQREKIINGTEFHGYLKTSLRKNGIKKIKTFSTEKKLLKKKWFDEYMQKCKDCEARKKKGLLLFAEYSEILWI